MDYRGVRLWLEDVSYQHDGPPQHTDPSQGVPGAMRPSALVELLASDSPVMERTVGTKPTSSRRSRALRLHSRSSGKVRITGIVLPESVGTELIVRSGGLESLVWCMREQDGATMTCTVRLVEGVCLRIISSLSRDVLRRSVYKVLSSYYKPAETH